MLENVLRVRAPSVLVGTGFHWVMELFRITPPSSLWLCHQCVDKNDRCRGSSSEPSGTVLKQAWLTIHSSLVVPCDIMIFQRWLYRRCCLFTSDDLRWSISRFMLYTSSALDITWNSDIQSCQFDFIFSRLCDKGLHFVSWALHRCKASDHSTMVAVVDLHRIPLNTLGR